MAVKIHVLMMMLVLAGVAPPLAHGLLGLNIGGLLSSLLSVTGVVPCSVGNSINLSTSSVFPNAGVQLRCGGNIVGSSTTNSNGAFSIIGGVPTALLSGLLSSCNVIVTTPLVSCNVSLPATGFLSAAVSPINSLLGITNLVTGDFSLVQRILN